MMPRVLVLDDEPTNRAVIAFVLRNAGYDVREAATGIDALHMGHHQRITVLVADLRLPDRPGTEVARALRNDWPDMAILFTSGTPIQYWTQAERGVLHALSGAVDCPGKAVLPHCLFTRGGRALAPSARNSLDRTGRNRQYIG
jgi:CheY-like chemotaxis protein